MGSETSWELCSKYSWFHCYLSQSNCELWNEYHEFDLEVRFKIYELRFQVAKAAVGMACAEGDRNDELVIDKHQLDSETFTCIYETLKANQFCTRLKIKLTREEEFNLMFNKQFCLVRKLCYSTKFLCWESNLPFKNPRLLDCEKKRGIHLPKTQDLKR